MTLPNPKLLARTLHVAAQRLPEHVANETHFESQCSNRSARAGLWMFHFSFLQDFNGYFEYSYSRNQLVCPPFRCFAQEREVGLHFFLWSRWNVSHFNSRNGLARYHLDNFSDRSIYSY